MAFEREIILILREANSDKGLPVSSIVRNVYNMVAVDLFASQSFDTVSFEVSKYLRTESSHKSGAVEKTNQRGWYRLNKNSSVVEQLLFDFELPEEDEWMM